jgi:hypothetical protein
VRGTNREQGKNISGTDEEQMMEQIGEQMKSNKPRRVCEKSCIDFATFRQPVTRRKRKNSNENKKFEILFTVELTVEEYVRFSFVREWAAGHTPAYWAPRVR